MNNGFVLSVSQLNRYVKSIIEQDDNLQTVFVKGEISNFKNHYSGHYYMTVKDEFSQIKAVMFKSANSRLKFMPEDSMSVIIKGRISVFERDGQYQLYIDDMQPDGIGALSVAFEQLKKKLAAEGLFAQERKKPVPRYPGKVGVITSATGAAVRDIINVISRRYPAAEIVLYPVQVQGDGAAEQIAYAVEYMNESSAADVLIVGRGGGSAEDLWAFNEETVARAVAASTIPVISAVGHETDYTICDFAADLRAPTPSAAAELAVPDKRELAEKLDNIRDRMNAAVTQRIKSETAVLALAEDKLKRLSPQNRVEAMSFEIDKTVEKMNSAVQRIFAEKSSGFSSLCAKLDALSPLKILSRGYSAVLKNGIAVSSSAMLSVGDVLDIKFGAGSAECTVTDVKG